MRFNLKFLEEFIDLKESAEQIAEKLTMAGFEIAHLEKVGEDVIFEGEVTSNRYDWLSIFGIAAEISAVVKNKPFKIKYPKIITSPQLKPNLIKIEDFQDCPVYVARLIENVSVAPSPQKIKDNLQRCGINVINNIVDITNYCMLKWGNPLHAFDYDKIKGNIYVRRAQEGERFLGLDGKERKLTKDNLVIADEEKIIALAGVMGAANSQVDNNTRNILLEAAVFSPIVIRRSRRLLGIQTESSYRFERNVSDVLLEFASQQATDLIVQLANGRYKGYLKHSRSKKTTSKLIKLDIAKANQYLGTTITKSKIKKILVNLGFELLADKENQISLKPPFYREDLLLAEDIYEEIARLYGYNNIPACLPAVVNKAQEDRFYRFKKQVASFMAQLGLREIISYSMADKEDFSILGYEENTLIHLENPLRSMESVLRPTLLAGMVNVIKYNYNQKNIGLKFFEIAKGYYLNKNIPQEKTMLAIITMDKEENIFFLKSILKEFFTFLGGIEYSFAEFNRQTYEQALAITHKGENIGYLGYITNRILEKYDLKEKISFLELDLEKLFDLKKDIIYKPFSRYPFITRDISLALSESCRFADIEKIICAYTTSLLKNYQLVDIYKDKKTNQLKSITIRLFFQSSQRTLTAEEVDKVNESIRNELASLDGVVLR